MGSQKYDDDEQIVANATNDDDSGKFGGSLFDVGKVPLKFDNEPEVPIEDNEYKLLIELMGRGTGSDRLGADIVMVLDISGSMQGEKLKEMKRALQFVIKKLSPSDRLSVVTFSSDADRKCPLRQMTQKAQEEIDFLVQNLSADGNTNITAGLQKGLKVLDERKFTTGRSGAIMLMSDGEQNAGGDATMVSVERFPVFTFGFGSGGEYDPKVLNAIAKNSSGGTFSFASPGNLSIAFSQCLGGLLSVLVQDVKLILIPLTDKVSRREKVTTKIIKVYAGNYPQTRDDSTGAVTVFFGDLYQKEIRTVLVDLFLPAVSQEVDLDALEISCTYRADSGNLTSTNPAVFRVTRSKTPVTKQSDAAKAEIQRVEIVEIMKEARNLADQNKFDEALDKAVEAQNLLDDFDLKKPNQVIETLKLEVNEMVKFLQSEETYKAKGRSFTYSSETSHDRQRFASRGDVEKIRPFAIPRMDDYLEQAKAFEKDPTKPVPTAAEDEKKELAADPLGAVSPSISYYLAIAIDALQNIKKIVDQK
ncbi:unnamed protein product [Amaranthus hypochondriacus]